jgi:flagellar hook-associated protein 3 FlgL
MRISTNTMYEAGVSRVTELQSGMLKTQQQLSTGRRILSPADDPVAAARALDLTQGQSINTQFAANRVNAKNSLSLEEGVLQSVTSLIQDVKTQTVEAGNGAYDDTQRKFIATNLRGRLDELMGLANSRDGVGNFMFSGYQTTAQPFSPAATGAQYAGDQGQRLLQVGPARQMAISDAGDAVFDNISGNGTLASAAAAANAGNATASRVSVFDANALPAVPRSSYDVTFGVAAGVTTWSVNTVPPTTGPYTSGTPIRFEGLQMTVTDGSTAIADGDTFTVRPSRNQSLFTTMSDLIKVLETPAAGVTGKANLTQGLSTANGNLDNALDSILSVRASIGSRLKEIDTLDDAGADRNIQYSQALSQLQDVDYAKAISDLTQQQVTLEAAQKSFVKISGLSLFNLL